MDILVINCGSSSLKYQLLDMSTEEVIAKGLCDRIGMDGSTVKHSLPDGRSCLVEETVIDHADAFDHVLALLTKGELSVIKDISEISAVGHRVVHGGSKFTKSCIVTDEVLKEIRDVSIFAPLHNPAAVTGIKSAIKVMGEAMPQIAVFDTAFHQTMPEKAYMYGTPYEYYEKYGIRRYGFHGSSHRIVSQKTADMLGKKVEDLKMVICHLGNGSSICAVDRGKSVDTSMGFSPLPGLLMGTRCGDLDPTIIGYMGDVLGVSGHDIVTDLNKKGGLLGVSGVSSDNRDVQDAAEGGNARAQLALDMLDYQIVKYIGGYAAAMGGIDAIVFTGGIGENDGNHRKNVASYLGFLGVKIDEEANNSRGTKNLTAKDATVSMLVIETNEELMIARDTLELVKHK